MLVWGVEVAAGTPCLYEEVARVPLVGIKPQGALTEAALEKAWKHWLSHNI